MKYGKPHFTFEGRLWYCQVWKTKDWMASIGFGRTVQDAWRSWLTTQ